MHYLQHTEITPSYSLYNIHLSICYYCGFHSSSWLSDQDIHIDLLLPEAFSKMTVMFCIQFYVCHEGIWSEVDKWIVIQRIKF
jgi:hypothetical protein